MAAKPDSLAIRVGISVKSCAAGVDNFRGNRTTFLTAADSSLRPADSNGCIYCIAFSAASNESFVFRKLSRSSGIPRPYITVETGPRSRTNTLFPDSTK